LVGRSRALEIVLSAYDFDADIAERYGWVNRALDDDDIDAFVDTLSMIAGLLHVSEGLYVIVVLSARRMALDTAEPSRFLSESAPTETIAFAESPSPSATIVTYLSMATQHPV
jgi:enoyl-CoA hydratase/carnithine racemase